MGSEEMGDYLQTIIEPLDAVYFIHRGWYIHASPTELAIAEVAACEVVRDPSALLALEIANPTNLFGRKVASLQKSYRFECRWSGQNS